MKKVLHFMSQGEKSMGFFKAFINNVKKEYEKEMMRTLDDRKKIEEEARQKGEEFARDLFNLPSKILSKTSDITRTTTTKSDFKYYPKWRVKDGKKDLFDIAERSVIYNDKEYEYRAKTINAELIPEGYFPCGFCSGTGFYSWYGDPFFKYDRVRHISGGVICPVCGGWKYIPDFKIKCPNCGDIHLASLDTSETYCFGTKVKIIGNRIVYETRDRKNYPTWHTNITTAYKDDEYANYKGKCYKCGENFKINVRFKDLEKSYLE